MTLDVDAARDGRRRPRGASSASASSELAEGICDVVNAKMAQAIRTLTVEQGIEPRDFALVAFGGAGPMHAAFLARELEIARGHRAAPTPARSPPGACCETRDPPGLQPRRTSRRSRDADRADARRGARASSRREGFAALDRGGRRAPTRAACEHALDIRYVGPGVHADRSRSTGAGEPLRDGLRRRALERASTRRTRRATATPTPARRSSSSSCARRRSATSAAPSRRARRRSAAPDAVPPRARSASSTGAALRRADRRAATTSPPGAVVEGPAIVDGAHRDDGRAARAHACAVDAFGALVVASGEEA